MIFNDAEREQFIVEGYVLLRGVVSGEVARKCRNFVWNQVPLWDECTTYGKSMVHLRKGFNCAPFDEIKRDRLAEGLDQLVGINRWKAPEGYGWWPLLFPGFPGPGGWHVDGGQFSCTGSLTEHRHALVTLILFSDVGPGDGGTPMVRGSHLAVARAVAEHHVPVEWPVIKQVLSDRGLLNPTDAQIAQVVGEAGDVALLHPFLIHGFGANQGKRIRFACNPLVQMSDEAVLERADGAYSAVERALRKGIGIE